MWNYAEPLAATAADNTEAPDGPVDVAPSRDRYEEEKEEEEVAGADGELLEDIADG
jgi:hypothetical protein